MPLKCDLKWTSHGRYPTVSILQPNAEQNWQDDAIEIDADYQCVAGLNQNILPYKC